MILHPGNYTFSVPSSEVPWPASTVVLTWNCSAGCSTSHLVPFLDAA